MKKMVLLLLLLASCGPDSKHSQSKDPVPPTPTPIVTVTQPTEEECLLNESKVWIYEDRKCLALSSFKLPRLNSISAERNLPSLRAYAQVTNKIEKVFTNLPNVSVLNIESNLTTPVKLLENGEMYLDQDYDLSAISNLMEIEILQQGVYDNTLKGIFKGFAAAKLSDLVKVRELFLKQVSMFPVRNGVTVIVGGSELQTTVQITPDNTNYIVVIDSTKVTSKDISELLTKIK